MPDIRDIVAQTSALEKFPSIDQKNQELKAEKRALAQVDQNVIKQELVANTKEVASKTIREEQQREKYEHETHKREKKHAKEEEPKKEPEELNSADVIEIDEGKIIDVKV